MVDGPKWEDEAGRWLKPFLDRLGHKARLRMCPLYVSGLIGPAIPKRATDGGAAVAATMTSAPFHR